MKGVFDVEYIVSVVVFLSIISFVTYSIVSNIPTFRTEASNEDIRSKAYQLSNVLLLDKGSDNWENEVTLETLGDFRVGLSTEEKYVLDRDKVDKLNALCVGDGYKNIRSWFFGTTTFSDFRINLTDGTNTIVECGLKGTRTVSTEFQVVRFGVLDGSVVKLLVSVT